MIELEDAKILGRLMEIEIPESDVDLPYAVFIKEKIKELNNERKN